jgi:hypothetical protein
MTKYVFQEDYNIRPPDLVQFHFSQSSSWYVVISAVRSRYQVRQSNSRDVEFTGEISMNKVSNSVGIELRNRPNLPDFENNEIQDDLVD